MGGSSGNTQAGGPAPVPLFNAENRIFAPLGYPNASGAASGAFGGIQGLSSGFGGANQLGQAGQGAVGAAGPWASTAFTSGNQLAPFISQILQTGFDPQNALYARTQQQVRDQANAQNAMSGVASTPYGASVADQANSNFNIDWQNAQLGRQQTALSGAEGGIGTQQAGQGLGASILSQLLGAGGSALSASQAPMQQQIADFLAYLSGNTANSSAFAGGVNNTYANALGGAGLTNQAQQQSNQGALAGLGGLGALLGAGLKFLPNG